ncbi:MAG: acyl-CoA desaturase [Bacteroidota bacterium]
MSQKVKFIDSSRSEFFATTRKRVDAYFKENNLSKHANGAMWGKTIFFFVGLVTLYVLIMAGHFGAWPMLGLAILLGMFTSFVTFNIGHDANHGAFSASSKVNKLLSLTFAFLGASPYMWNITHNQVHHTLTNIPGHDEDIEIAPGLVRISEEEKVNKLQTYQHFYAFFLYSLASISWVLRKDYKKFFQKKIGQYDNTNHPKIEYFNLFFYKAVYYFLFIILPLYVLDITWWQFIIGFVVMHLAEGLVLGLVFQLAHVVEGMAFPLTNEEGNIEEAWAIHQMQTTANFARKSWLANVICGGLNTQIEHHLFPRICHIHYSAISDIVKQTAEEFNVPYIENATFFSALQSHYRMLRKLGKEAYQEQHLTVHRKREVAVA